MKIVNKKWPSDSKARGYKPAGEHTLKPCCWAKPTDTIGSVQLLDLEKNKILTLRLRSKNGSAGDVWQLYGMDAKELYKAHKKGLYVRYFRKDKNIAEDYLLKDVRKRGNEQ